MYSKSHKKLKKIHKQFSEKKKFAVKLKTKPLDRSFSALGEIAYKRSIKFGMIRQSYILLCTISILHMQAQM